MSHIRGFTENDLPRMITIWNEIVVAGDAFPQEKVLDQSEARGFFSGQSFTGIFEEAGDILGLYILHPNNVGRCGHIANASYAVKNGQRGKRIGERLILHSMDKSRELGFRILQFNAVTASNAGALHLYRKLGFTRLGRIPGGFRAKNGEYVDIIPHFIEVV